METSTFFASDNLTLVDEQNVPKFIGKKINLKLLISFLFFISSLSLSSQNIINWKTININNSLYTLQVDANISQLDLENDLFYSGNRNHINSFFLVDNNGQRINNSDIEQKAINTCESFFNLTNSLEWPDECNFQIDPLELNFYTGNDNQNNPVDLYFPNAFDESYFNSHVWIGMGGFEGLHNYNRRKNCYTTIWEACLMPEVTLLMNMDDVENEIFEQWGDKVIEIFGSQASMNKQTLLTGLVQFRDALILESQLAQDVKLLKFGDEVNHLMDIISLQSSTLSMSTNGLLGILTYHFSRAYTSERIAAIESMFSNLSPNDYDIAMYEGFLTAKTHIQDPLYTSLDIILSAFLGSPELRLANTFQFAISKTQDLIKELADQNVIQPSIATLNVYLALELFDELAWLYEGETLFQYVSLCSTIQKFVGLYISTHLSTNNYNKMNELLSLYDIMTFSSLNFYNYQKQRLTLDPPNWLVLCLNTFQTWFSSSGIQGYSDYLDYLNYWIDYYLYGNTKRYFFVKNPVNMLSKNHKIYLQENMYPFIQGSDLVSNCGNQREFSITYRNSVNHEPNNVNLTLNNQQISLSNTNVNFSEGVVYSGQATINSGQNNYHYSTNVDLQFPSSSTKTFNYPFTGNLTINGTQASLYDGIINPQQGNVTTTFQFSVKFQDVVAPQYVKIIGSGWSQTMSTTGTSFCSGVNYTGNKSFGTIGTYEFYFEAQTSNNSILRYPSTGYLTFIVNPASGQGITLGLSTNPVIVNNQVILTALLNPIQGNYPVHFYADPNVPQFSPANGIAYTNSSGIATISYYPTATGNIDMIAVDGLNSSVWDMETLHVQPVQTNISIIVSHNRIGVQNNEVMYDINIRVYDNGSPYYNYYVTFGTNFGQWENGLQTHTFWSGSYILGDRLYCTQNGTANISITVENTTVNYPLQIQYTIPTMNPVKTISLDVAESVSFKPGDDKFAYTGINDKVYIYDVSDGQVFADFTFNGSNGNPFNASIVRYNLDGTKMFVGSDLGSRIVNATFGSSFGQSLALNSSIKYDMHSANIGDACWVNSTKIVICSEDADYFYINGVFNTSNLSPITQLFPQNYDISQIDTKGNLTIVSVSDCDCADAGFSRLFNSSFNALYTFNPPGNGEHYGGGLSPDGSKTVISDAYDNILYQYNTSTYNQINNFSSNAPGYLMDWNPVFVNYLGCVHGNINELIIWDVVNGTQYTAATGIPEESDVAWSSDGKVLVTVGGGEINIFAPFDQNPPFVFIESPTQNFSTILSTITISGYISDDSQVSSAEYQVNSTSWIPLTLNSDGQFNTSVNLIVGANTIQVKGYDRFGKNSIVSVSGTRLLNQFPPAIIVNPTNIICNIGDTVSFSVNATGTTPFTYQWKKDGDNTGGNSSILFRNFVSTSDIGNYLCIVSNPYGSDTSNIASLFIALPSAPSTISTVPKSSSQIDVSWENVNYEDGYYIYRGFDSTGVYSQIASVGSNVTTYSDTSLNPSIQYCYKIKAYNSGGSSPYSPLICTSTFPFEPHKIWTGIISNEWSNPGNWNSSGVPQSTNDIFIPSAVAYMPVVNDNGFSSNDVSVAKGAELTINSGKNLIINGLLTLEENCGTFIDSRNNKVYHSVLIGEQCWMKENLNVGTRIYGSLNQTNNGIIEKYCYNDLESNCDIYGGLYQWNEYMNYTPSSSLDSIYRQGICPLGWHIPSDAEWTTLSTYLGGGSVAGGKMKEEGTSHWISPNTGASNSTGFNALPGGYRYANGAFYLQANAGYFWSSTESTSSLAWFRLLYYDTEYMSRDNKSKVQGFSGRCLKDCDPPTSPTSSTNSSSPTQIIWAWNAVTGAIGYKWNTIDDYNSAIDMGTSTIKTETGLTCNTTYTRYAWAYSSCGNSTSLIMNQATSPCLYICGQTLTDSRDGKTYNTVLIGIQCWFAQNLNVGTKILGNAEQTNNSMIEKYCYNNDDANCAVYGGLYQWAEMVQYLNGSTNSTSWVPVPTGNVQGICPTGWHLPTDAEWTILTNFLGGMSTAGGAMKEVGTTHWLAPNTAATNSSGFTGLPGGFRRNTNGTFSYNSTVDYTYSCTENNSTTAWDRDLLYSDGVVYRYSRDKYFGFSVRCLRDCNIPAQPTTGVHIPDQTQIIWNWNSVAGATGYKWNTVNDYTTAFNIGTDTIKIEAGLICGTTYTRYIWSYNDCGYTLPVTLTQTTNMCTSGIPCPGMPTIIYAGQTYNTVLIGTQCWLKENLNVGVRINGSSNQIDNGTIEKYCYNNDDLNCNIYGGMYKWAEMMNYTTASNSNPSGRQGICPDNWHIPSDVEWTQLSNYLEGPTVAGGKMKEAGYTHWNSPNTDAVNTSGFTGLGGGQNVGYNLGISTYFWSSAEYSSGNAWARHLDYNSGAITRDNGGNGEYQSFYVRCVHD